MRLLRDLFAVLTDAAASGFPMGGDEDAVFEKLRRRLQTLRRRSRRLLTSGTVVFFACAASLTALPLVVEAGGWHRGAVAVVTGLLMVAGGAGALEAARLLTLIESLEDLLSSGAPMARSDIVLAFRDHVHAELAPEPSFGPLVEILSAAYDTTAMVRATLQDAGIPLAQINLSQPIVDVWRDALRVAHRRRGLETLLGRVLSDPNVARYHEPLRACRARM